MPGAAGRDRAAVQDAEHVRHQAAVDDLNLDGRAGVAANEEPHFARKQGDAHSRARCRGATGQRKRGLVRSAVHVVRLVAVPPTCPPAQAPAAPAGLEAAVRSKRVVRIVRPGCKGRRSRRRAGDAEARRGRSGARRHCDRTADEAESERRSRTSHERIEYHRSPPRITAVDDPDFLLSLWLWGEWWHPPVRGLAMRVKDSPRWADTVEHGGVGRDWISLARKRRAFGRP